MTYTKDELIEMRREHVAEKLKDVPKHLFRKKVIDLANNLFISPRTIYYDLQASKHR
ncbi:MAG: hypothetical protein GY861_05500 [bacterium]|nr:hypothetical protein [bacterium]